jgi:hypothetical protein
LTFPNEKEKVAYKYDQSKMKGLIILFLSECDWGKCADGDLKADSIANGNVTVTVNEIQVSSITDIGSGCVILKHDDGVYWRPSASGDYEIAVEVKLAASYVRISSIVIY